MDRYTLELIRGEDERQAQESALLNPPRQVISQAAPQSAVAPRQPAALETAVQQTQAPSAPARPQPTRKPPTWGEVAKKPEFQALSNDDREVVRHQYFVDVLAPNFATEDLDEVRTAFDADTKPSRMRMAIDKLNETLRTIGGGEPGQAATDLVRSGISAIDTGLKQPVTDVPEQKPFDRPFTERVQGYMAKGLDSHEADLAAQRDVTRGTDNSQPIRHDITGPSMTKFGREFMRGLGTLGSTLDGWEMAAQAEQAELIRNKAAETGRTPEQIDPDYPKVVEAYQRARDRMQRRTTELDLSYPRSSVVRNMFKGEGADAVDNFVKGFEEDPGGAFSAVVGGSVAPSLAFLSAAVLARFAGFSPGVAATAGGATSAITEFGNEYAGLVSDPNKPISHDEAFERAAIKSGVIGLFDAASMSSAGKALDQLSKGPVKVWLKESSRQAALGAGGETWGAVASGKEPHPGEVAAEAVGEFVMGVPEGVGTMRGKTAKLSEPPKEETGTIPGREPSALDLPATTEELLGKVPARAPAAAPGPGDRIGTINRMLGDIASKIEEGGPSNEHPANVAHFKKRAEELLAERAQLERAQNPDVDAEALQRQNRDRSRAASVTQMQEIANAPDYDRMATAPIPDVGAPMVSVKGDTALPAGDVGKASVVTLGDGTKVPVRYAVVESDSVLASHDADGKRNAEYFGEIPQGRIVAMTNGRVAGLQAAYGRETAKPYVEKLLADPAHGVSAEAIRAKQRPMLVRVFDDTYNKLPRLAELSNTGGSAPLSTVEKARGDAARITSLEGFSPSESGDVGATSNMPFVRQFMQAIPKSERGELMTAGGELSQEGARRLRAAVFAKAYGGGDALARMVESTDDNVRSIVAGLMRAAPAVARLREQVAAGALQDLDITADVLRAVEELSRLREQGVSVGTWLAQADMFGSLSPELVGLLEFLEENARSGRRIADFLERYLAAAEAIGAPGGMFETETPGKAAIVRGIRKEMADERETGLPQGERTAAPDAGPAAGGVAGAGAQPGARAPQPVQKVEEREGGKGAEGGTGLTVEQVDGKWWVSDTAGDLAEFDTEGAARRFATNMEKRTPTVDVMQRAIDKVGEQRFQELVTERMERAAQRKLPQDEQVIVEATARDIVGDVDPLKAELDDALADLGGWVEANLLPKAALIDDNAEENLLPILTRLFTVAIKMGYRDFAAASKFVMKEIRKKAAQLADLINDALLQRAFKEAGEGALLEMPILKRAVESAARDAKNLGDLTQRLSAAIQSESGVEIPGEALARIYSRDKAVPAEHPINRASADSKFIGDLLLAVAASPQFNGTVNIPSSLSRSGRVVKAHMLGGAENLKILQGIVQRVPVHVMDVLVGEKLAPKGALDDVAVKNVTPAVESDLTVSGDSVRPSHKETVNATSRIRSDTGQLNQAGQIGQGGEADRGGDVQQTPEAGAAPGDQQVQPRRDGGERDQRIERLLAARAALRGQEIPSRAASAGETALPSETSPTVALVEGTQDLAALSKTSTRPEPSESLTTRAIPKSVSEGAIRTDLKLGSIDETSNNIITQPIDDATELVRMATEVLPEVDRIVASVAKAVAGTSQPARPKGKKRLDEKLATRPAYVISDYVGARLVVPSRKAMNAAVRAFLDDHGGFDVDDFTGTSRKGYRAVHLQIKLSNGMSAEVQILSQQMAEAQEAYHPTYDETRTLKTLTPEQALAVERMERAYLRAWQAFEAGQPWVHGKIEPEAKRERPQPDERPKGAEAGDAEGAARPADERAERRGQMGLGFTDEGEGAGVEREAARARERTSRPGEEDGGGRESGRGDVGRAGLRDTASGGDRPAAAVENYTITAADELGAGGDKTKARRNLRAIRLLKDITKEDRRATPEEQAILIGYVGWGGLKSTFDEGNADWAKERAAAAELKKAEAELAKPFEHAAELDEVREKHRKIQADLLKSGGAIEMSPKMQKELAAARAARVKPTEPETALRRDAAYRGLAGMAPAAVSRMAERIGRALPGLPKVIVLDKVSEAPTALAADIKRLGGEADTAGAWHDGQVYLFAENITNPAHAEWVILHEGTHHGLRGLLGPNAKPLFMDIYMKNGAVRKLANEQMRRNPALSRVAAVEEALANMGADGVPQSVIGQIVAWIRKVLRQAGVALHMSEGDIRELVSKALRYIEKKAPATHVAGRTATALARAAAGPAIPTRPMTPAARRGYTAWAHKAIDTIDNWLDPIGKLPEKEEYLIGRYKTLGVISRADELAVGIRAAFQDATTEDKQAVYDYLVTAGATPGAIKDATVRANAGQVKAEIGKVGDALVDRGMLSEESREQYRDGYLPRLYLKHLLSDADFTALGAGKKPSNMGYLKQRKDIPEDVRKVILGEITDPGYLAAVAVAKPLRDMVLLDWLATISAKDKWVLPSVLVKWGDTNLLKPAAFPQQFGAEIPTRLVSAYWLKDEAARMRKQSEYQDKATAARALDIATQMERAANRALEGMPADRKGYKQIPDTARYGRMRGIWVRSEIYDDLMGVNDFIPADPGIFQSLFGYGGIGTRITQIWKTLMVALNPPGQVRNFVANGVLLNLSGVAMPMVPVRIIQAAREIINDGKHWKIAKKYGIKKSTFASEELYRAKRDLLALERDTEGMHPIAAMHHIAAKVMEWGGDMYQFSESLFKTAKIIDEMAKGKPEQKAMLEAQKWLFDYSLVHRNVRFLRNNPIGVPFLTFMVKSAPRMAEVALLHPWRFLPYAAILYGMAYAVAAMYDVDDDDLEKLKKALPEWLQERGHAMLLPYKDEQGRWQVLDLGYFFPWTQPVEIFNQVKEGEVGKAVKSAGLLSGPLTDLIVAARSGKDPFTGRDIYKAGDPPTRQAYAIMNYLWTMAAPPFLTEKGALGHGIRAATGETNKFGDPISTPGQAALRLIGINVYAMNPEQSRAANMRKQEFEINEVRQAAKDQLQNRALTPEKRSTLINEYNEETKRRAGKLQQYIKDSQIHPNLRTEP